MPDDEGGHTIARRFDGPTDAFNHFAQNRDVNRSGYRKLENLWAAAKTEGKTVEVTITPVYEGSSLRPTEIRIRYQIDGEPFSRTVPNPRESSRNGK